MAMLIRTGLLLLLAMQPLVLWAADIPAVPLIARGDRNFPPYEFINENGEPTASTSIFSRLSPAGWR